MRTLFIFIIMVGFLSSLMSTCSRQVASASDSGSHLRTLHELQADRLRAASGGGTSDASSGFGDAVVLHREGDGHFYADAEVNGASVRMLVDTGASAIALTRDDARKAGIGISIGMPNVVGQGASGDVKGEYVTVNRIRLGGKTGEDMNAVVLDGGGMSLLGQTFLSKFSSVEIHGDTMVLR